jgi:transposase InsO family protein
VERRAVLDVLHSPRFADQAPAEVYASLLDEGVYHCSIRTMYRVLAANQEVRERRNQLRYPVYKKPELLAQAPNEVWSWDITKLMGRQNGRTSTSTSLSTSSAAESLADASPTGKAPPCSRHCSMTPPPSIPHRPAS